MLNCFVQKKSLLTRALFYTQRQNNYSANQQFIKESLCYVEHTHSCPGIAWSKRNVRAVYALPITVKFYQSTRRLGRKRFAPLFKLTKDIASLFYFLSPHLLSCIRGSRNVRKKGHFKDDYNILHLGANSDVVEFEFSQPDLRWASEALK